MSVLSSLMNSRGRFNKKRRSAENSTSPRKRAPQKPAGEQSAKKRRKKDGGGDLLTMKRLRESRDSTPQQESAAAVPQALEERVGKTSEMQAPDRLVQAVGVVDGSTAAGEAGHNDRRDVQASDDADKPCAAPENEAQAQKDDGMFGDLFDNLVEEEVSVTEALVASMPHVAADELVDEAAKVSAMLRNSTSGSA